MARPRQTTTPSEWHRHVIPEYIESINELTQDELVEKWPQIMELGKFPVPGGRKPVTLSARPFAKSWNIGYARKTPDGKIHWYDIDQVPFKNRSNLRIHKDVLGERLWDISRGTMDKPRNPYVDGAVKAVNTADAGSGKLDDIKEVLRWYVYPNQSDVEGIDTPGSLYIPSRDSNAKAIIIGATPEEREFIEKILKDSLSTREQKIVRNLIIEVRRSAGKGIAGFYRSHGSYGPREKNNKNPDLIVIQKDFLKNPRGEWEDNTTVHELIHFLRNRDPIRNEDPVNKAAAGYGNIKDMDLEESFTDLETNVRSQMNPATMRSGYYHYTSEPKYLQEYAHREMSRLGAISKRTKKQQDLLEYYFLIAATLSGRDVQKGKYKRQFEGKLPYDWAWSFLHKDPLPQLDKVDEDKVLSDYHPSFFFESDGAKRIYDRALARAPLTKVLKAGAEPLGKIDEYGGDDRSLFMKATEFSPGESYIPVIGGPDVAKRDATTKNYEEFLFPKVSMNPKSLQDPSNKKILQAMKKPSKGMRAVARTNRIYPHSVLSSASVRSKAEAVDNYFKHRNSKGQIVRTQIYDPNAVLTSAQLRALATPKNAKKGGQLSQWKDGKLVKSQVPRNHKKVRASIFNKGKM